MKTVRLDQRDITPGKIICIGRNYAAHIAELGNETPDAMVFFSKPNSAISTRLSSHRGEPLHYEGELSFIVENGRYSAVGFGLDLTKRALQSKLKEKGLPWERAKAFDGAAVFSEFVPIDGVTDDLEFTLTINGAATQHGNLELMMHKPDAILAEIKTFMTLNDGDIVMTGTPKGVGEVHAGERFDARVSCSSGTLLEASWVAE